MSNSSLSVVLLNYNHGHYLTQSLGAILAQSRLPDELIIVDDASTDNSVQIIESLISRAPFVTFLRNETNQGVVWTTRRAWERATGDYIYFAAADDRVRPGFFEKTMQMLEEFPQAGLCCSYLSTLDDVTGKISENPLGWSSVRRYFTPEEVTRIPGILGIPGHASIIKRSAFLDAGAYLPDLKWHCDWFNSLVVAFRQGICHIPESLALMRMLPTSYSATGTRDPVARRQVYEQVAHLLETETFRDVAPLFYASGVLYRMNADYFLPLHQQRGINVPDYLLFPHLSADVLHEQLQNPDARTRELAAFWLRQFVVDRAKLIGWLRAIVADEDPYVRLAAVNSLYSLTSQEVPPSWQAAAMTRLTFRLEQQISVAHRKGVPRPASLDWLLRRCAGTLANSLCRRIPLIDETPN